MLHQAPATKTQRPLFMLLCTESLDVSRSSLVWMLRAEPLAIKWPCCPEENKHTADKVTKVWGGEKKKKTEKRESGREERTRLWEEEIWSDGMSDVGSYCRLDMGDVSLFILMWQLPSIEKVATQYSNIDIWLFNDRSILLHTSILPLKSSAPREKSDLPCLHLLIVIIIIIDYCEWSHFFRSLSSWLSVSHVTLVWHCTPWQLLLRLFVNSAIDQP